MVYTPPNYNSIDADLLIEYAPPSFDSVSADLSLSGNGGSCISTLSQLYSLVDPARSQLDQDYTLLYHAMSKLEQNWYNSVRASFYQFYENAPFVRSSLDQVYFNSPTVLNTLIQKYDDAKILRNSLDQEYTLLHNLVSVLGQNYSISDNVVRSQLDQEYEIQSNNLVRSSLVSMYSLVSGGVTDEVISPDPPYIPDTPWELGDPYTPPDPWEPGDDIQIQAVVNNNAIDFIGFSLSASFGNYLITCVLELPSETEYLKCQYEDYGIITINDTVFFLMVEDRSTTTSAGVVKYTITLVSITVRLDAPYSKPITQSFPDGIMAKQLVIDMAALGGFSVDWQLIDFSTSLNGELDWFLPSDVISVNEETPLTVIKKVVNSVGAKVQTAPDNTIIIMSEYPIPVPNWDAENPTTVFGIDQEINSITTDLDIRQGYNAFSIANQATTDEDITLEVVDVDSTSKKVRGFRVPFDDGEFPLETSGGSTVLIDKTTNPVIMDVPEIDPTDDDPEEWEVIEFIDWVGTTSLPIYSVLNFYWIEEDLGAFTFSEDGTLTIVDQSSVPSESLLRIKYTTKYWEWSVSGKLDIPIQFYVPKIGE